MAALGWEPNPALYDMYDYALIYEAWLTERNTIEQSLEGIYIPDSVKQVFQLNDEYEEPTDDNWGWENQRAAACFVAGAALAPNVPVAAIIIIAGLGFVIWDNITNNNDSALNLDISWAKPGVPTKKDGYVPPKNWNGQKVKNPNGPGSGYPDKNGNVWVPTDHSGTHAGHWDVQHPGGGHTPVYPK